MAKQLPAQTVMARKRRMNKLVANERKTAGRELSAAITNKTIEAAHKQYLEGKIGPWELQEVVEKCGFKGWTGNADGTITIHTTLGGK